jgi:predicted PurR-regulated permease PerM
MEQQSVEQSINKKQRYTLIGLIVVLGLILFNQTRPYMSGLLGAFTLYVLLNRQMAFLCEKLKFGKAFSAIILLLEAFLFFLLPLTGIALLVIDTLSGIHIDPQLALEQVTGFINKIESRFHIEIFTPQNLSMLPKLGGSFLQILGSSVYSLSINTIVIIFVLYFMLYNYQSFGKIIREIIPFNE